MARSAFRLGDDDLRDEEVWHVVTGEVEMTVDGERAVVGAGGFAVVPAGARHAVRALSSGTALAVDHQVRDDA